jgi:3-hydroxybutyryl-CoA dehydrogenase
MKKIGIIGEGKMGTNIFYYLVNHKYPLRWVVSNEADPAVLEKTFRKKIRRMYETGQISEKKHEFLNTEISISNDLAIFGDCDLIIEAVSENLKLKQFVFMQLEKATPERCVLATNSSSILPADLTALVERKDKVIGLHFFYPVALKNIVEYVRNPDTSAETSKKVDIFLSSISRNFITLDAENAFMMNRIFLDLQTEAFSIVSEGLGTYEEVDRFVKMYITPPGVFEFCDYVGNDIMLTSVMNYVSHEKSKAKYLPFMVELDRLVKAGRLGKKTSHGFFSYNGSLMVPSTKASDLAPAAVRRLHNALGRSVARFSKSTGFPETKINELLK